MMQAVKADLLEARDLLPEQHPYSNFRVSKDASTALLARVSLYLQDWTNAVIYAKEIIDKVSYALVPLNEIFLRGSAESIFSLESTIGMFQNTGEGSGLLPYDEYSTPKCYLQPSLLQAFEAGDQRLQQWVGLNTATGDTIRYPAKYKAGFAEAITEDYVMLRLAEQYLILAEALAQLDQPSEAMNYLNVIRERAGLPAVQGTTRDEALYLIAQERRTELFAEWGHRWFDLKRTGKANEVFASPTWQPTDMLYPIPFSQLQLNPNLQQNPGYQ